MLWLSLKYKNVSFPSNFLLFRVSFQPPFLLDSFLCVFCQYFEKSNFPDFKPSPTCNVRSSFMCNGRKDCYDYSDEIGCQCPDGWFECPCYQSDDGCGWRRRGCIHQSYVCDGNNYCGDWSDEKFCLNTKHYCRNDECVERSKQPNGRRKKVSCNGSH